jgi:hypothetical protein
MRALLLPSLELFLHLDEGFDRPACPMHPDGDAGCST